MIGGATITLADSAGVSGGSWGADGNIILGAEQAGLSRVSAAGGKAEVLTKPDPKKGERNHNFPEILPGGQAVLFTIGVGAPFDDSKIAVLSLKTGEQRVLVEGGTSARYVPTGHLACRVAVCDSVRPARPTGDRITRPRGGYKAW